jgi:hypothetical protein
VAAAFLPSALDGDSDMSSVGQFVALLRGMSKDLGGFVQRVERHRAEGHELLKGARPDNTSCLHDASGIGPGGRLLLVPAIDTELSAPEGRWWSPCPPPRFTTGSKIG